MSAVTTSAPAPSPASPASSLRVVPAPRTDPAPAAAAPALRLLVSPGQTELPLRLGDAPVEDLQPALEPFGVRPTGSDGLPDPSALVTALAGAVVEVLAGSRPPTQLLRWASADVYAGVQRRAALGARVRASRPAGGAARGTGGRVAVLRVRCTSPRDGVVEASAVVAEGRRVRATALRLEALDHRWRITALEVG